MRVCCLLPLLMHSFCMQRQLIVCAPSKAINNNHVGRIACRTCMRTPMGLPCSVHILAHWSALADSSPAGSLVTCRHRRQSVCMQHQVIWAPLCMRH
jgi:hypothetical protein